MTTILLNGREYRPPTRPTVVICADGCDPSYLDHGLASGQLPTVANPNNVSIVTGAPPSVHGISGNFYLDRETGTEIMMTDPALMRSETVLALMSQAGVPTAAITAKDKLRRLLGRGLRGICFSSEQADRCTLAEHGIDNVE